MLSLWPSLPALRQLYLDEQAIAAGAKNSALYTDEAIVQREMLRSHPRVVSALDYFWESIPKEEATHISKEEVRRARQIVSSLQPVSLFVTSRLVAHLNSTRVLLLHSSQGMTIARKFYLITRIEQAEAPDPNAWIEQASADFHSDSSGKGFLSREDAHRAWFQLCDLHTEDVSALSYASYR